jgi:hypothetical protein
MMIDTYGKHSGDSGGFVLIAIVIVVMIAIVLWMYVL